MPSSSPTISSSSTSLFPLVSQQILFSLLTRSHTRARTSASQLYLLILVENVVVGGDDPSHLGERGRGTVASGSIHVVSLHQRWAFVLYLLGLG